MNTHTTSSPPKHDAHCRRPGCPCTHLTCFRGWIDPRPPAEEDPQGGWTPPTGTTPCDLCRPHLWRRWLEACKARQADYPIEAVQRILREGTQQS